MTFYLSSSQCWNLYQARPSALPPQWECTVHVQSWLAELQAAMYQYKWHITCLPSALSSDLTVGPCNSNTIKPSKSWDRQRCAGLKRDGFRETLYQYVSLRVTEFWTKKLENNSRCTTLFLIMQTVFTCHSIYAIARKCYHPSVCPSVHLSVRLVDHTKIFHHTVAPSL